MLPSSITEWLYRNKKNWLFASYKMKCDIEKLIPLH